MSDIAVIDSRQLATRIFLGVMLIAALSVAWLGVRGQIGNLLNEITRPTDPDAGQISEIAESMAPGDPLGMWLRGTIQRPILTSARGADAAVFFENTVRLAPRDFRWWTELGRAYEQAGEFAKAEAALRRATAIAPTYNLPRWQLGNFLLRQNRADEAFAELKLATVNNYAYRDQVFSLAWNYFDNDPAMLEAVIMQNPETYSSLAMFYAVRGRAEDALRNWERLSTDEKAANQAIAKTIAQGLYDKRHFNQALAFARDLGIDRDAQRETITNGGFESGLSQAADTYFNWRNVRGEPRLDIATDTIVKRSDAKSLRIAFRGYSKPELYTVLQTVAVTSGQRYRLSFWIRTENLKSGGAPQIEIINANDDRLIAASKPFSQGTSDWSNVQIDFAVPDNAEGIVVRTSRSYCGDNCPIVGTLWYDDFSLERLG